MIKEEERFSKEIIEAAIRDGRLSRRGDKTTCIENSL
jgi:hypothetical protein